MKAWIAAVALAGGMLSSYVMAESATSDGNNLLKSCNITVRVVDGQQQALNQEDNLRIGQCYGLIEGIRGSMIILELQPGNKHSTCFPEKGIRNDQATRIVVKYLNDHPSTLNEDQTLLTMLAFKDAYPCK